ncbi:hypothetical protein Cni_G28240 [Canna indica]|uniref:Uncharacterized protein n=1 Tax=Canna indica TaxID=4628 RepID=A0AAQ3L978_9LILI|nr:hypothetical protein Cni_G28240 [Canna indica]
MQSVVVARRGSGATGEAMDRESKKRGREEPQEGGVAPAGAEMSRKKGKGSETEIGGVPAGESSCRVEIVDALRPPGLFEFPWEKGAPTKREGWESDDLHEVFFSSLVDGCSAAIGFPGDRLSPGPAAWSFVSLPEEPADGDVDGVWSAVLYQPLSTVYRRNCNA